MSDLQLPPLFQGLAVPASVDPFDKARAEAARGCDAGLVVHAPAPDRLRAAMVFAPDVVLAESMIMLPLCAVGFQNALGALAPPEVAVHLDWDGGLRINGAACGRLQVAADTIDPDAATQWLVVGLDLPFWPESDSPGDTPDQTTLHAEGCGDVDGDMLLESWVKHTLVGINTWEDQGVELLHREWRGLAHGIGEDTTRAGRTGTFMGVDERFGMLLRDATTTHLIPLTTLLETT